MKLKNTEIEKRINGLGFELLMVERIKKIICVHFKSKDGYIMAQHLYNIKGDKTIFSPKNPYVIENIRLWTKINKKQFDIVSKKYHKSNEKLDWLCYKCDEIFFASYYHVKNGHGCGVCDGKQVRHKTSFGYHYSKLICEWSGKNEITPFDVAPYSHKKVLWECNKCEREWMSRISHRVSGRGCPYCSSSKSEQNMMLILNKLEIDFIREMIFDDCHYEYNLRFDFYLPEYNLCIELNGMQHYEFVEYFHKNEEGFFKQKQKDKIKKEYCINNEIEFLEISFIEFENIEEVLIKSLFEGV